MKSTSLEGSVALSDFKDLKEKVFTLSRNVSLLNVPGSETTDSSTIPQYHDVPGQSSDSFNPQILLLTESNHLENLPPMTSMRENITSCYLVSLKSRMVHLALNNSILIMMRCPMFYTELMRILIMSA